MGAISNPPTCVTGVFVREDQGQFILTECLTARSWADGFVPRVVGSPSGAFTLDSHTEWHAKDPDRLCSPADFITAALKHPNPGEASYTVDGFYGFSEELTALTEWLH